MEGIINGIRKFSLRNWVLIALGISILQYLLAFTGLKGSTLEMNMIISRIPDLIIIASLICFGINQEKKIEGSLIIGILGFLISIIGVFNMFSGFSGTILREAIGSEYSTPGDVEEYIYEHMFTFNIIQIFLYLVALSIGLTSINSKKLKSPYIVIFVGYITSLISLCINNVDNVVFQLIPLLIFLIGMIWLIIIGGKKNTQIFVSTQEEKIQVKSEHASNPNPNPKSATIKDKSQQLFKLKELMDSGIITEEEFNTEKAKILKQ